MVPALRTDMLVRPGTPPRRQLRPAPVAALPLLGVSDFRWPLTYVTQLSFATVRVSFGQKDFGRLAFIAGDIGQPKTQESDLTMVTRLSLEKRVRSAPDNTPSNPTATTSRHRMPSFWRQ